MGSGVSRRNFVALGAVAIGGLATTPAFAAKIISPKKTSHAHDAKVLHLGGKHSKHGHHGMVARGGAENDFAADSGGTAPRIPARPNTRERFISLVNSHTDEGIHAVYWREGTYLPDTMHQVNHVMRDHMSGDTHTMDPNLIDLLGDLRQSVGSSDPWVLISGYRSPRTNAWMHRHRCGVAAHSMHIQGRAADIVLPGEDIGMLHNAALDLGEGGVGYYPRSGFVHVDTGKVREWEFE